MRHGTEAAGVGGSTPEERSRAGIAALLALAQDRRPARPYRPQTTALLERMLARRRTPGRWHGDPGDL